MARPLPFVAAFLVLMIITTNLSSTANANSGSLLTVYWGHQCFDGPSETYRHCGCHNIEHNYRHHHHHHRHVASYEYKHFHGRPATLFEDRDCGGSPYRLPGQEDRKCSGHFPWKSVMIWC
ncbi:uncharacterized protein LOC116249936 [Nymphaea colorata]|uniref:uncharacterized protein LOC116249936 n=1 Tax=Nymphaea colorata TaxID=210225 RepID=UPI00129E05FC|nr:uncharacterized protein LOC116249936 [Nymphaea colorata]